MPIHLPNLRCLPDFVVGIPVALDTLRNSQVIPKARFQEKVIPGPSFISILSASILLLPTFIVGLFGQNFHFTREIEYHWGWPISVAVIVIITCGQVFYFKRKKWL